MQHDPKTGHPDPKLAIELFDLVERDQGFAFISDGCEVLSREEIFNLARGALKYSRRVVRNLEKFLAAKGARPFVARGELTPTRLRQIAAQLECACSAYQEKITRHGYKPCRTCQEMAGELREFAADGSPDTLPAPSEDLTPA